MRIRLTLGRPVPALFTHHVGRLPANWATPLMRTARGAPLCRARQYRQNNKRRCLADHTTNTDAQWGGYRSPVPGLRAVRTYLTRHWVVSRVA